MYSGYGLALDNDTARNVTTFGVDNNFSCNFLGLDEVTTFRINGRFV